MARYKHIDTSPRLLPVDLSRQLLPGTFEHALNHLLDHEVDLSGFDARYCDDETGASAYAPAMLLKIVLFAYSQGIIGSRPIERVCREHITFIALSGDSAPHFTTIAGFVSALGDDIARIFARVLFICDRQGLIGRELFAIDGVKLPSNASKARSGTRADFERQVAFFQGKAVNTPESHTDRMKKRIDSPAGRVLYGQRFATVEPVFGNLRHNKGLDRFTLRGRAKVDTQWKLFCLVHNIEKLAHHGYAQ